MNPVVQVLAVAGALLVGYALGWESAHFAARREATMPPTPAADKERRRPRLDNGVVVYVVLAVALLLAGYSVLQNSRQADQTTGCVNAYASQLAGSLNARQQATEERQKAEQQVFVVALRLRQGKASESEYTQALTTYQTAAEQLTKIRERSPYPAPPSVACR